MRLLILSTPHNDLEIRYKIQNLIPPAVIPRHQDIFWETAKNKNNSAGIFHTDFLDRRKKLGNNVLENYQVASIHLVTFHRGVPVSHYRYSTNRNTFPQTAIPKSQRCISTLLCDLQRYGDTLDRPRWSCTGLPPLIFSSLYLSLRFWPSGAKCSDRRFFRTRLFTECQGQEDDEKRRRRRLTPRSSAPTVERTLWSVALPSQYRCVYTRTCACVPRSF